MSSYTTERVASAPGFSPSPDHLDGQQRRMLMIAFNYPPAATAGVHRTLRFTKYLPEFGCLPAVLTRVCPNSIAGDQLLEQIPAEVIVHRVGQSPEPPEGNAGKAPTSEADDRSLQDRLPPRGSLGKRLIRSLKDLGRPARDLFTETPDQYIGWSRLATARGLQLCRDGGFDVVYTTGPPHSTHLAGVKIRRKTGLPWIADFRDPWARRPWSKARNPWGQRLLPYFESKIVHHASCVIVNNEASADDFRRAYPHLPPEKFISIPNGYDPDLLAVTERLRHERVGQRLGDPPVVCHPGTLYGERNPRPILEAIGRLHRQGVEVRFQQIGFVGPRFDLRQMANEQGIEHLIECVPPVPHAEVMQRMAQAEILMIIQPNGPLMVPGKLYEMLLFDQPILAVCDSIATSRVIDSAGDARSVGSQDAQGIAEALAAMLQPHDPSGRAKRQLARSRYNGRDLAGKLSQVIASVTR